jgi:hypothetical protein
MYHFGEKVEITTQRIEAVAEQAQMPYELVEKILRYDWIFQWEHTQWAMTASVTEVAGWVDAQKIYFQSS